MQHLLALQVLERQQQLAQPQPQRGLGQGRLLARRAAEGRAGARKASAVWRRTEALARTAR